MATRETVLKPYPKSIPISFTSGTGSAEVPIIPTTAPYGLIVLRLCADQDCWVAVDTVCPTDGTGMFLPANTAEYVAYDFESATGLTMSAAGVTAAGTLNVTKCG